MIRKVTFIIFLLSLLIAFFDTATAMPVTGNGGDITIIWDTGANKIFKL